MFKPIVALLDDRLELVTRELYPERAFFATSEILGGITKI
jgi:hypothetical protein